MGCNEWLYWDLSVMGLYGLYWFPAGLLSREAARYTESFVMTIGIGDDFIMRLSVESFEDLRGQLFHVLQACRLPKVYA